MSTTLSPNVGTPGTAGELRRRLAAERATWTVDPRYRDEDVLPVYHCGCDLKKVPKVKDVPRVDIAPVLKSLDANPFLLRRRIENGLIDEASLPAGIRVAPKATGVAPRIAASVDWRNRFGWPWLTRIKNQNPSENCWVFGAVGLVEAMTRISHCTWALRSEGDARDGSGALTVDGGYPGDILNWVRDHGVADNGCWPTEVANGWDFWLLQKINEGGVTSGAAATSGPFIGVFHAQQHFAYIDASGNIWDAWYDGSGYWAVQLLNTTGKTPSLPARQGGAISVWVDPSNTQQHFTYATTTNQIMDMFWDSNANAWKCQTIDTGGASPSGSPTACVYHEQQHIAFVDGSGNVMDAEYDGSHWSLQKLNNHGRTSVPGAAIGSRVSVWVDPSNTQQHFAYRGADGAIYDAYWDSNSNGWHAQKLTLGGLTGGPAAASDPVGCSYGKQQHVAYIDATGTLRDAWYDGSGHWAVQQLNNFGLTYSPLAAGDLVLCVFGDQLHFTYRDITGNVHDGFQRDGWHQQAISGSNAAGEISLPISPDVWNAASNYQPLYGPPAAGGLSVSSYGNQQHFAYRDASGAIWDAYFHSDSEIRYAPASDRDGRAVRIDAFESAGGTATVGQLTIALNDVAQQKQWLDNVGPITACFEVYADFQNGSEVKDGVYKQQSNDDQGGHCVLIVGYDDAQGAWLLRNQWGTGWGQSGYCWFGYGQCGIDDNVKYGIAPAQISADPWTRRFQHHGGLLESNGGTGHRNFEVWTAETSGAVRHYWRDGSTFAWSAAETFGGDCAATPSAITSTFGNFEMVYRTTGNALHHWYHADSDGAYHSGATFGVDVAGDPGFVQSNYGAPGNFEVVVAVAGGKLAHYSRANSPIGSFALRATFGSNVAHSGPTLVQRADRGFDVVVVRSDGALQRYARSSDLAGAVWTAQETFGAGVASTPVMIAGQTGAVDETVTGNYELLVAAGGRVQHWSRANSGNGAWTMTDSFATNVPNATISKVLGLVESSFAFNLEAVVLLSNGSVQHFYRDAAGWHSDAVFGSATA